MERFLNLRDLSHVSHLVKSPVYVSRPIEKKGCLLEDGKMDGRDLRVGVGQDEGGSKRRD